MSIPVSQALSRALEVVIPALDIAVERPRGPEPPAFCQVRDLTAFLSGLSQEELARCETEGLANRLPELENVPPQLAKLAKDLLEISKLPQTVPNDKPTPIGKRRSVSERKQSEIEALLTLVAPLAARALRVVDVGAGRGHFTRIAAEIFDRDTVGIERVPERVETAERLGTGTRASFILRDATHEALGLQARDLAIGLHACGALGDRLITEAAEAGSDVALVSCCLQKITASQRLPFSSLARAAGLCLSKETLGLSNLMSRRQGVESTLDETMDARRKRWALGRLLRQRGIITQLGEEMRGVNRRWAHRPFADLVQKVLQQRGLEAASTTEIEEQDRLGTIEFDKVRRFSLPRSMLARALEVTVALDRAAYLEEHGYHAQVIELCPLDVTPRNLAIVASTRSQTEA